MSGITNNIGADSGVVGTTVDDGKAMTAGTFMIYDENHWSPSNGGCCLAWIPPVGTQMITFEVLSGGGPGGSSSHDHDIGHGGAGGNYNTKTVCVDAGDFVPGTTTYTLCAGGTSECSCCLSCNRNCRHGCPSYVTGAGLSNFCAVGGQGGATSWDVMAGCYSCHIGTLQCDRGQMNAGWVNFTTPGTTAFGGDNAYACFRGVAAGVHKGYDCCNEIYVGTGASAGPFSAPWSGGGKHYCVGGPACCSAHSVFPGGGGPGMGQAGPTACTGGFGAGGLVKVTYQ